MVVDQAHSREIHYYRDYLKDLGYESELLVVRPPELSSLAYVHSIREKEYVFDFTKS